MSVPHADDLSDRFARVSAQSSGPDLGRTRDSLFSGGTDACAISEISQTVREMSARVDRAGPASELAHATNQQAAAQAASARRKANAMTPEDRRHKRNLDQSRRRQEAKHKASQGSAEPIHNTSTADTMALGLSNKQDAAAGALPHFLIDRVEGMDTADPLDRMPRPRSTFWADDFDLRTVAPESQEIVRRMRSATEYLPRWLRPGPAVMDSPPLRHLRPFYKILPPAPCIPATSQRLAPEQQSDLLSFSLELIDSMKETPPPFWDPEDRSYPNGNGFGILSVHASYEPAYVAAAVAIEWGWFHNFGAPDLPAAVKALRPEERIHGSATSAVKDWLARIHQCDEVKLQRLASYTRQRHDTAIAVMALPQVAVLKGALRGGRWYQRMLDDCVRPWKQHVHDPWTPALVTEWLEWAAAKFSGKSWPRLPMYDI